MMEAAPLRIWRPMDLISQSSSLAVRVSPMRLQLHTPGEHAKAAAPYSP